MILQYMMHFQNCLVKYDRLQQEQMVIEGFFFGILTTLFAIHKCFTVDYFSFLMKWTITVLPMVKNQIHRMIWRSKAEADFILGLSVNSCSLLLSFVPGETPPRFIFIWAISPQNADRSVTDHLQWLKRFMLNAFLGVMIPFSPGKWLWRTS